MARKTKTQAQANGAKITAVLEGRTEYADLWETTPIGTASGVLYSQQVIARIRHSETGWGELQVIDPREGDTVGFLRYSPERYTSYDGTQVDGLLAPWAAQWDFGGELPNEYLGRFPDVMAAIRFMMRR
jgi:hypothetical protein